jgi:hypothetical protein
MDFCCSHEKFDEKRRKTNEFFFGIDRYSFENVVEIEKEIVNVLCFFLLRSVKEFWFVCSIFFFECGIVVRFERGAK